jgi:glucosamine-6-phosphate deaminase
MKIIRCKNNNSVAKISAILIINEVLLNPKCVLGFATGDTPIKTYNELIKAYKKYNVDFSDITAFNLDEYYPIKKEDKNSYYNFMHKRLFNHINICEKNINILDGEAKNPEKESFIYENKIKNKGIDLQILGIGRNGHIGFNEPGSSFTSKTRLVELKKSTINDNSKMFKNKGMVPKKALSMGISTIIEAKKIVMLAVGKNKSKAIKEMIKKVININCPASILRKHKNFILVADEAALSLL